MGWYSQKIKKLKKKERKCELIPSVQRFHLRLQPRWGEKKKKSLRSLMRTESRLSTETFAIDLIDPLHVWKYHCSIEST